MTVSARWRDFHTEQNGRVERELLSSFRGEAPYARIGGGHIYRFVARRNTNNGRLELDVRPPDHC